MCVYAMCVCVYVCMYVCVYMHVCVCMCVCICVYMCMCVCICIYVCVYGMCVYMCVQSCCLEWFKSLEEKEVLLNAATQTGDGNCIIAVLIYLRRTVNLGIGGVWLMGGGGCVGRLEKRLKGGTRLGKRLVRAQHMRK